MEEKKQEISDLIGRSRSQSNFLRFLSVFIVAFIIGFVAGLFVESKIKTPRTEKVARENIQIVGEERGKAVTPGEEVAETPQEITVVKPPEEVAEKQRSEEEKAVPTIPEAPQVENYTIQVISCSSESNALNVMSRLGQQGYKVRLKKVKVRGKEYTRVYIIQIPNLEKARQIAQLMKQKYHLKSTPIIRKE